MKAYHTFAQQQRPLLKGVSPGEREKLLSQRWKALSKAEKAHYKGCEDTSQAPRGSAYSAFCRARRPLLPPTLSNPAREAALGELWAGLSEREREAYLVAGSRAPVPAPDSAPVPAPAPAALVPAPAPATASVAQGKDGLKNKRAKNAASMVSYSAPENTAASLVPAAPAPASAPPFLALTAPSSTPTSPTASHSLSTDADDDEHEWEKYLLSDNDFFISSSLASLDA